MNTEAYFKEKFKNQKVLFVTSKNIDYIRNTQETRLIAESGANIKILGSKSKHYFLRLIKTYALFFKELCLKKYDYIFIGFAPQLYFFFFPLLKKKKVIIDFFISMYDTLVDDRKKVKKDTFLAKILHKVDGYVLKKASFIICDTIADREYFAEEFSISKSKFKVLYLKADVSIYDPEKYQKKANRDCFEVLYFGSILPLQGIEVVLESMRRLDSEKNIHFTIIGPIDKKYKVDKIQYPNTQFFDWMSQEGLAEKIAGADVCLAGHFSKDIGKANRTIAGKTYIYKAMRKPVILGDSKANRELFKEDHMNYFVPLGDSKQLADVIKKISIGNQEEKHED